MARPRWLPKVLTPDEQWALLAKFDRRYPSALRNLIAVRLMLECGLRCGEAVAVRPEHIDLDTCRLLVRDDEPKAAGEQIEEVGELLLADRSLNDSDLVVGETVELVDTVVNLSFKSQR